MLLRAEGPAADGACKFQVLTGYRNPFPTGRNVLGSRCMKLATVEAPVEDAMEEGSQEAQSRPGRRAKVYRPTVVEIAAPPLDMAAE